MSEVIEANATQNAETTTAVSTPAEVKIETTTTEVKTAETAEPTVAAEAAQIVPEKYELKLPENSQLKAEHIAKVEAYAKEKGLTNEQAQTLVDRESTAVAEFAQGQQEMLKEKTKAWFEDIKADKELGGDKFNETVELSKRALDRFATPELKDALNKTGMGNHPDLVRMFSKIGREMGEDKIIRSSEQTQESLAEQLYPTMKK